MNREVGRGASGKVFQHREHDRRDVTLVPPRDPEPKVSSDGRAGAAEATRAIRAVRAAVQTIGAGGLSAYRRLRHPDQLGKRILTDVRSRDRLIFNNLAALVQHHQEPGRGLTASEFKVFSQNGEDGVIAEIFRRIGTSNRYFVEFGIGNGSEGNSVFLADVLGWSGLFIESSAGHFAGLHRKYQNRDAVTAVFAQVTRDNINRLLSDSGVPSHIDLLSIDIDGNDYWVWEALNAVAPRVVVIEYNGLLSTSACLVQPYEARGWTRTDFFGASLGALRALARRKGYVLVHTELSGTNAFFVQEELATHFADIEPVDDRALSYSLQGVAPPAGRAPRSYVVVDDGDGGEGLLPPPR